MELAQIVDGLVARTKTMVGVSIRVRIRAPGAIERTLVGKARRVFDNRPKN